MRAVIQRVTSASVTVGDKVVGAIDHGMLILLGVESGDTVEDAKYLADKSMHLRIFNDDNGKMNRSVVDVGGSILVVSQFTLLGDCRKGRRPSFVKAAAPDVGNALYQEFVELIRQQNIGVATGQFQAHMDVVLTNDGPVTLMLESRKLF